VSFKLLRAQKGRNEVPPQPVALRINSSTVQRGVLEIDAGERLPVGVAGDPGAMGAFAALRHEAAVPAAVQGAPAHAQARLRLRARGPTEELLILDAGNEVALNVDQTGGNSPAPEWRAPFAPASSARVEALDFKGLVRTVAAVSGR
jgi:hypothetical protein